MNPISIIFFAGFVCLYISYLLWDSSRRGPFPKTNVDYIVKRAEELRREEEE